MSDKILAAFDHACDEGELEVAAELLDTLEVVLLRVAPQPERRDLVVGPLLSLHERLWHLRSRQTGDQDGRLPIGAASFAAAAEISCADSGSR